MSEEQTQRLISQLAGDLAPVRRAPSLRAGMSAALLVSALVFGYALARDGVRADWQGVISGDASYVAVLLGLLAVGLGATLVALAGAIPGRESETRRGAVLAGVGLATAVLVALFALFSEGFAGALADDWMCLSAALYLCPLPLAALLFVVSRGWVANPGATSIATLAGAGVAGALAIHLACSLDGARHFLLGHVAAPVLLALVAFLPLAWLLRRMAR